MESSTGTFHRDCVLASFRECRRHCSSWEVSRESQSSPLRFFVESITTDHQEVSSFFFSEKKTRHMRSRTRDLEPRSRVTCQPATVTYLILVYQMRYLYLSYVYNFEKPSNSGSPRNSNYLDASLRFRRTFAEGITFGEAVAFEI